jgi:hypothetical protein
MCGLLYATGAAAPLGAQRACGCDAPREAVPPSLHGPTTRELPGSARGRDRDGWWWLLAGLGVFVVPRDRDDALGERSPGRIATTDVAPAPLVRMTAVDGRPADSAVAGAGFDALPGTAVPWPTAAPDRLVGASADDQSSSASVRNLAAEQRALALKPLLVTGALEAAACGLAVAWRRRRNAPAARRGRRGTVRHASRGARPHAPRPAPRPAAHRPTPAYTEAVRTLRRTTPPRRVRPPAPTATGCTPGAGDR